MKLHNQIMDLVYILFYIRVINRLNKFKSSKRLLQVICVSYDLSTELCAQLGKFGDIFMMTVNESDPDHTQKIANAYNTIVKGAGDEPLEMAVVFPII